MTVIIIRGGRGSGKTFLVGKVLACADRNDPYSEHIDQTLLPQPRPTQESKDFKLGHILNNGRVFVVGWYDTSMSSGPDRYQRQIKQCDNLLFNLLSKKEKEHRHVLFEYIGCSLSDWRFPSSVRSRFGILANQPAQASSIIAFVMAMGSRWIRSSESVSPPRQNSCTDSRSGLDSAVSTSLGNPTGMMRSLV
jgi:hypothetical protein